jgi:hypothetical protein
MRYIHQRQAITPFSHEDCGKTLIAKLRKINYKSWPQGPYLKKLAEDP